MMGFRWSSALKAKDTSIFSRAVKKARKDAGTKGRKAPRVRKGKKDDR